MANIREIRGNGAIREIKGNGGLRVGERGDSDELTI